MTKLSTLFNPFKRADQLTDDARSIGTVVAIETPGKTFKLPLDTVSNFQSALLDGMLECARPDIDGIIRLPLLDVDTRVFKETLLSMRTRRYATPPTWVEGEARTDEFRRQLEFLAPQTWSNKVIDIDGVKSKAGPHPLGFVRIEAGVFFCDTSRYPSVCPNPFLMKTTPVTQSEWHQLRGSNPSHFCRLSAAGNHPVEKVTWYDALHFCNALSEREGLTQAYDLGDWPGTDPYSGPNHVAWNEKADGYRLPTEIEWEHAARAGTITSTYAAWGQSLDAIAWHADNSDDSTHPVGRKLPNAWGLHDMLGNVWEWTWDWADGCKIGLEGRALRGGSYYSYEIDASYHSMDQENTKRTDIGFRPVRSCA